MPTDQRTTIQMLRDAAAETSSQRRQARYLARADHLEALVNVPQAIGHGGLPYYEGMWKGIGLMNDPPSATPEAGARLQIPLATSAAPVFVEMPAELPPPSATPAPTFQQLVERAGPLPTTGLASAESPPGCVIHAWPLDMSGPCMNCGAAPNTD